MPPKASKQAWNSSLVKAKKDFFCVVAGEPCVLFLLGGGWKAMCFFLGGEW